MGCISSKAIARSMSLREELNHGFQSTSVAWEELLTSHSGNDHLFAFVCSTNKLSSSSFTLPSTDPQTPAQSKYPANAFDLLQDINEKTESKSTPGIDPEFDFTRFTRSKSCHMPGDENKLDWKDKSQTGSRSFHTVEEYDALLERIHKSTTGKGSLEDYLEGIKLQHTSNEDQVNGYIQRYTKDCLNDRDSSSVGKQENVENVVDGGGKSDTGWKRKERAKGLKMLDVPTIEFPAMARVKRWTHLGGQVYSPGTYVTPKFGSYNAKVNPEIEENQGGENMVFSPELVAAFEDCMEQLQVEEDCILRNMDEHYLVDDEIHHRVEEQQSNIIADITND